MIAVVVFVMLGLLLAVWLIAGAATICDGTSCEWCGDECDERWSW